MAKFEPSLAEIRRQIREAPPRDPAFVVSTIAVAEDALRIRLKSGVGIEIPLTLIPEVDPAAPAVVRVRARGDAVEWPDLDVGLNLQGLIVDALGPEIIQREMAKRNGARTSEAKARAVRENGKKGGRPRKAKA